MSKCKPPVIVVGSGPNGLVAAIVLAAAGMPVTVWERSPVLGGGAQTAELTLPGFRHDMCSSNFPLGAASPIFQALQLEKQGLTWVHPEIPLAHPLDGGSAVLLHRDLASTAAALHADGPKWRNLLTPLVEDWPVVVANFLGPLRLPAPRSSNLHFGRLAWRSCSRLVKMAFDEDPARALLGGLAAHGAAPLQAAGTAAFGMILAAATHVRGMPFTLGGAQALATALIDLAGMFEVNFETGTEAAAWRELEPWPVKVLDMGPRQVAKLAEPVLPSRALRRLRSFRYGLGVCKVDYALREPVPWRDQGSHQAGVLHLGGTWTEIAESLDAVWAGKLAPRPFVIAHQPATWDVSRTPPGGHILGAYCHVPLNCQEDVSGLIENQIERFAPGFREVVLDRHVMTAQNWPAHNPNLVGGDISGGLQDLGQMWQRPLDWRDPYRLPAPGLFLCSASTPPGGGVHGLCGFHAALSVLRHCGCQEFTLTDLKHAVSKTAGGSRFDRK